MEAGEYSFHVADEDAWSLEAASMRYTAADDSIYAVDETAGVCSTV